MKRRTFPLFLSVTLLGMLLASCTVLAKRCGGAKQKVCPSIYRPICGSDGKTHSNRCMAGWKKVKVAYPGRCLARKVKLPSCKKGWRLVRKDTKGKASAACPKGICTTFHCVAPDPYVDGGYVDPKCKGPSCVVASHPFKGSVFRCPRGFVPVTVATTSGKRRQRCKKK